MYINKFEGLRAAWEASCGILGGPCFPFRRGAVGELMKMCVIRLTDVSDSLVWVPLLAPFAFGSVSQKQFCALTYWGGERAFFLDRVGESPPDRGRLNSLDGVHFKLHLYFCSQLYHFTQAPVIVEPPSLSDHHTCCCLLISSLPGPVQLTWQGPIQWHFPLWSLLWCTGRISHFPLLLPKLFQLSLSWYRHCLTGYSWAVFCAHVGALWTLDSCLDPLWVGPETSYSLLGNACWIGESLSLLAICYISAVYQALCQVLKIQTDIDHLCRQRVEETGQW